MIAGGTSTCETSIEKLSSPCPGRKVHGHRVGRGGGLEPDAEEDDLPVGVLLSQPDRVERRVDDAHVAALAFTRNRSCSLPGTRSMSPNEQKITSGTRGDRQRLVDHLQRGDAHRAAGTVDQLDLGRQQLVDAVADDASASARRRPP